MGAEMVSCNVPECQSAEVTTVMTAPPSKAPRTGGVKPAWTCQVNLCVPGLMDVPSPHSAMPRCAKATRRQTWTWVHVLIGLVLLVYYPHTTHAHAQRRQVISSGCWNNYYMLWRSTKKNTTLDRFTGKWVLYHCITDTVIQCIILCLCHKLKIQYENKLLGLNNF